MPHKYACLLHVYQENMTHKLAAPYCENPCFILFFYIGRCVSQDCNALFSMSFFFTDTQFGMTFPGSNGGLYAYCVLRPRSEIHGRAVLPGNVVVLVTHILRKGLRPIRPGRFDEDEPVSVGGYYEWPCSQVVLL